MSSAKENGRDVDIKYRSSFHSAFNCFMKRVKIEKFIKTRSSLLVREFLSVLFKPLMSYLSRKEKKELAKLICNNYDLRSIDTRVSRGRTTLYVPSKNVF